MRRGLASLEMDNPKEAMIGTMNKFHIFKIKI